jgi:hypothetical protein
VPMQVESGTILIQVRLAPMEVVAADASSGTDGAHADKVVSSQAT